MNKQDHNKISFKYPAVGQLISVIIPVYKDCRGLRSTLVSLYRQALEDYRLQIVVVNDGGAEEVRKMCEEEEVRLVTVVPNCGSYYARNRGLEYAAGELLAFIDAGITVPPNWLAAAVRKMGPGLYLAGEVDIEAAGIKSAAAAFQAANAFPVKRYIRESHYGVTAGLLVRRELIEKVGGFDQRLRSGGDNEFGTRVYAAIGRQVYLDSPALKHPPRTFRQLIKKVKRVRKGEAVLARLYPHRYAAKGVRDSMFQFFKAFLPPRPQGVKTLFPPEDGVPGWRKCLFLWARKLCQGFWILMYGIFPPGVDDDPGDVRVDGQYAIRILFISRLFPSRPPASAERVTPALYNLVKYWSRTEEVLVIRPVYVYLREILFGRKRRPRRETFSLEGIKVVRFPIFKIPRLAYWFWPLFSFLKKSGFKPQLVVGHYDKSLKIAYLYAQKQGLPLVAGIHIADDLLAPTAEAFDRRCGKIVAYASAIACRSFPICRTLEEWYPQYEKKMFPAISGVEAGIIADLRKTKARLRRWKSREGGQPCGRVHIVSACRLRPLKNIDINLRALAALDRQIDWRYTVIGGGEEEDRLRQLAAELGVADRVRFTGQLPREQVLQVLKRSHLFVMVSFPETFGLSYLEALAAGNIVIGAEGGGIDGIIVHGFNGFLCPPRSVEALKDQLELIIVTLSRRCLSTLLWNAHHTALLNTEERAAHHYLEKLYQVMGKSWVTNY